jgi:hypothetical protein
LPRPIRVFLPCFELSLSHSRVRPLEQRLCTGASWSEQPNRKLSCCHPPKVMSRLRASLCQSFLGMSPFWFSPCRGPCPEGSPAEPEGRERLGRIRREHPGPRSTFLTVMHGRGGSRPPAVLFGHLRRAQDPFN